MRERKREKRRGTATYLHGKILIDSWFLNTSRHTTHVGTSPFSYSKKTANQVMWFREKYEQYKLQFV